MHKPAPKLEANDTESTTELIEALCEISIDSAETPLPAPQIEAIERRLKAAEPCK